jgi:PAS domain S-box-containing protein
MLGAAGLVGWLTGARWLVQALPNHAPMMPNTAMSVLLLGVAGALPRRNRMQRVVALVAAGIVLAVAAATLAEYAFGVDLRIDELLVRTGVGPFPGRMSPPTAVAIACLAGALLLFDVRSESRFRPAELFALAAALIACTAALSELFGAGPLYPVEDQPVIGVAVITAVAVLLAATGLLLQRTETGMMSVATSRGPGGVMLRRLALAAVLGPVLANLTLSRLLDLFGLEQLPFVYATLAVTAIVLGLVLLTATAIPLERAHEALLENRARTQVLIEQAPDAIFVADSRGRYVEVNGAACRLLGYTQDELLARSIADLLLEEDLERFSGHRTRIFAGETEVGEWRLRRKDGSAVPVEVSAKLLPDGRWQAFVRDISDRKHVELQLRQAAERFELALRGADLAAWDWNVATGEVTFNERWAEMRGYRLDEIEPHVDTWTNGVHPDDRPHVRARLTDHFEGRTADYEAEHRVRTKDGGWIWVLDRGRVFARDQEGRPTRMVGTELDITARKRDEEVLRRRQSESTLLADLGAALGSTRDVDEAVLRFCTLAVRSIAEVCVVHLLPEGDDPPRLRVLARAPSQAWASDVLEGKQRMAGAWAGPTSSTIASRRAALITCESPEDLASLAATDEQRRALQAFDLRFLATAPLVARDEVLGAVAIGASTQSSAGSGLDVRYVEELAQRLALSIENARLHRAAQQAICARDDVLGVVAHDLRNPLSAILLQAALLSRTPPAGGTASRMGATIERAATRMKRLIEDLLHVTRMEAGQLALDREHVSPAELVAESLESQRALAESRSLELRVDLAPELPDVWADRDRLMQVLENLVGNALKFTDPGGRIVVGAAPQARDVLFWVADTGAGIAAKDVPYLFDRFWQSRKKSRAGAGLGLPIVKGLVEAHGGRVWVESAPGHGTTIFFTVPFAEHVDQPVEVERSERTAPVLARHAAVGDRDGEKRIDVRRSSAAAGAGEAGESRLAIVPDHVDVHGGGGEGA